MFQDSHISRKAPTVHNCLIEGEVGIADIATFGMLDSFTLFCGDRLILSMGTGSSGELCVMHDSTQQKSFSFARKYGNHYLHVETSKPMNPTRWNVLGVVVAIERGIGAMSCLDDDAYVAVYNVPVDLQRHFQEPKKCNPIYISELSRYLAHSYPQASCVVASQPELLQLDVVVPAGVLWVLPTFIEAPLFCDVPSWKAALDRDRRRKYAKKVQKPMMYQSAFPQKKRFDIALPLTGK